MSATNTIELTVGELSGALKRTLEDRFGHVRVRGEISNYRGQHSSGHAYFCLKDDAARIDAVVWKTTFARLKVRPQDGLEVIATGRVTTFPGKSTYQIVIEAIEPAGVGALMALLEARRKSLAAEGMFDAARKRPLPFLPATVGVVTSPTGAVIRDILHRIADRFPRPVLVWPVRVQGETAASEVAAAIAGFNALSPHGGITRPDIIIVARGGGSLEDLWAFNEELVVRAVAASAIPLIAAVGHETDWTLIDHAADLRAPTPSGAAEKVVPVRIDLIDQHADLARRHHAAMLRLVERRRGEARALARALPSAESLAALARQRIDRAEERLASSIAGANNRRHLELARLAQRLSAQAPRTRIEGMKHRLMSLEQRLTHCVERTRERRASDFMGCVKRFLNTRSTLGRDLELGREKSERLAMMLAHSWRRAAKGNRDRLDASGKLLNTLGYKNVLSRGYALVRDQDGDMVRSVDEVPSHAVLDIEMSDGHIAVRTNERGSSLRRKARLDRKSEQGLLF